MAITKPKVLRKLRIDEFSFCDVPANRDSTVLLFKRDGSLVAEPNQSAGSATTMTDEARRVAVAKAIGDKANAAVDEVMALIEASAGGRVREPIEKAGELLRDPIVYEAYSCRLVGVPYAHAVAKAEADHRPVIKAMVRDGDWKAFKELCDRDPAAAEQYQELTLAGAWDHR